jgi:hypothetical protein
VNGRQVIGCGVGHGVLSGNRRFQRPRRSDGGAYVGLTKIGALEKQWRVDALGERVSGAVAKIEARLRVHALAETRKRRERFPRMLLAEGHDLKIVILQKAPHPSERSLATAGADDHAGLKHGHSGDEKSFRFLNSLCLNRRIRLRLKDRDQSGAVYSDHMALTSSMISAGERGSSSGSAAISAPSARICSTVMRRRGRA